MAPRKITIIEYLVLAFISIIVIIGLIASRVNLQWFEQVYVVEDGFVENLTLWPLLCSIGVGIFYLKNLSKNRSAWFSVIVVFAIVFSFFVAGEEISWGQRIFHVQSSEFFKKNNAQAETNLHNLVVDGKKVNKIIFSQLLTVCIAFYLLILPYFYRKKQSWKKFIDYVGIPVPRLYQIIACILLFILISLIPSGKNAEILEAGITHIFFLIFVFPENIHVFRKNSLIY